MNGFEPLTRAVKTPPTEAQARVVMENHQGLTIEEAMVLLKAEYESAELWTNNQYQVLVRRHPQYTHLNIRRRDGEAIFRDWRHFQEIKNQLVGAEYEAVELYPAESRLVDTSNSYHLFASNDAAFRFPFGWTERNVVETTRSACPPGHAQRGYE